MPSSPETPLSDEQKNQWEGTIQTAGTTLDRSLTEYASSQRTVSLATALTSFLAMGDAVLRPPSAVSPDTRRETAAAYQDLCGVLGRLLPGEHEQKLFRLLPGELDVTAVQSSMRSHFGAYNDQVKRFSTLEEQGALADASHADLLAAALHLEYVGLLAHVRGPALQISNSALEPYRVFYKSETVRFKQLCANLSSVPETKVPDPPKTEALKPIELSQYPTLQQVIVETGKNAVGVLLDEKQLAQFPESITSPASDAGARTEYKGGHVGEGGKKRFISFFLGPLDTTHPLLLGISREELPKAQRAVAHNKATAEILGLALTAYTQPLIGEIAVAIGSNGRTLQDALVALRSSVMQKNHEIVKKRVPGYTETTSMEGIATISDKNVQLLRQAVSFIARVELGLSGPEDRDKRFLGIGAVVAVERQPSEATLRFMHLMNEVIRDGSVREKLGLTQLMLPR